MFNSFCVKDLNATVEIEKEQLKKKYQKIDQFEKRIKLVHILEFKHSSRKIISKYFILIYGEQLRTWTNSIFFVRLGIRLR